MNVRYPLGLLEKGEPVARNAELREFVRRSWQGEHVRYYADPVILLRVVPPYEQGGPDGASYPAQYTSELHLWHGEGDGVAGSEAFV